MGLDTVELVMSVEEAFEIQIDDQDAEHIQTVGELHDYIVARITMARTGTCLTASTSAALMRVLDLLQNLPRFFRIQIDEISGRNYKIQLNYVSLTLCAQTGS